MAETDFGYWYGITDHASEAAYVRSPKLIDRLISEEENTELEDTAPQASVETDPQLRVLSMGSFAQSHTASFLRLVGALAPEYQDMLLSYYLVGKTQEWIGKLYERPQYIVSAEVIHCNKVLTGQLVIGANPTIQQMRALLSQLNLEDQHLPIEAKKPATKPVSLSRLIYLYRKTRDFSQVAKTAGVHPPSVRRTIRNAANALLRSDQLTHVALALGTAGTASSDVLTVQGIASMTALKVDGSAVTQPVSASSLPLPTGAATSAKQPALGTAGTPSADVITVQGKASMTALLVDGSAVTQPISGTVGLNAGTSLIGITSSPSETSTVYSGTTALTPSFAIISASTSGASSLVAAVASKKIRVLALSVVANGAVNVKFQSHTTPTDLTGLHYLAANGGFILPFNPVGWFQTNSGEQLDINLSAAVAVGGMLTYVAV